MRKYYLKILYPSNQALYYIETIEADYMDYNSSSLFFRTGNFIVAVYPANYTIVEKIEEI